MFTVDRTSAENVVVEVSAAVGGVSGDIVFAAGVWGIYVGGVAEELEV